MTEWLSTCSYQGIVAASASERLRVCTCLFVQFLVLHLVLLAWLSHGSKKRCRLSFVVVQSLSNVQFFVTLWTAAHQTSLSFTISWSLLKLIESMMPSNHLILYHLLLLLPSVSQHQDLFWWISFSHQMAKVLEFQLQHQSFQWIFRIVLLSDWLVDLLAVQGTLKSLALFIYWSLL